MAKAAAKKETKKSDSPAEGIAKYLDRDVPRVITNFWRPAGEVGRKAEENALDKCEHSVARKDWCQKCGDKYLQSLI